MDLHDFLFIKAMLNGGGSGDGVSPTGKTWSTEDVYCFRQLLSHVKYDSASAGAIAEELLQSLESRSRRQGWSAEQIDLLDNLLSHVKYTNANSGEYGDTLIDSLNDQPIT